MAASSEFLSAMQEAQAVQDRAGGLGFEWPSAEPVFAKIEEECAELREAVREGVHQEMVEEMGDILFTAVNLACKLDLCPEKALRQASAKFERRFERMQELALLRGQCFAELGLAGQESLWREVKGEGSGI